MMVEVVGAERDPTIGQICWTVHRPQCCTVHQT